MTDEAPQFDRFQSLGLWATGGMADLFLVHDSEERRYLLKVPHEDESSRRAFEREASLCGKAIHPTLLLALSKGVWQGRPALLFPFLEGVTLHGLIPGLLPQESLRSLFAHAAKALLALHSRGLAHNDVTPANLFVSTQGQLFLLDFGLTAPFGEESQPGNLAYHDCDHAGLVAGDTRALVIGFVEAFRGSGLFSKADDAGDRDQRMMNELDQLGQSPLVHALRKLWQNPEKLDEITESLISTHKATEEEIRQALAQRVQSHYDWEQKSRTLVQPPDEPPATINPSSSPRTGWNASRFVLLAALATLGLSLALWSILLWQQDEPSLEAESARTVTEAITMQLVPTAKAASRARLVLRGLERLRPSALELDGLPLNPDTTQHALTVGNHILRVHVGDRWHELPLFAAPDRLTTVNLSRILPKDD